MPQLDKYIFFNQTIGLIVVFFLIYAYLRVYGIPIIGSLILYRKRRLAVYKVVNLAMRHVALHRHVIWRKRGNIFMPKFVETFVEGLDTFEEKATKRIIRLKNKLIRKMKKKVSKLRCRVTTESNRLLIIQKVYN